MKCCSGLDLIISEHEYGCMSKTPVQAGVHFTLVHVPGVRFNTDPPTQYNPQMIRRMNHKNEKPLSY